MQTKQIITVGADPELFFHNGDEYKQAIDYIKGTKNTPYFITKEGHAVLNDNVMAEFNIPPSLTAKEFIRNINIVKDYLSEKASEKDSIIEIKASAVFNYDELFKNTQGMEFGCEPDECIYENTDSADNLNLSMSMTRYAGGHIHVGYPKELYPNVERRIVEMMDFLLGVPSVILDPDRDRRIHYGKAGRFRIKPYGLEYRSLSNFWIENDEYMEYVFKQTNLAVNAVMSNVDSFFEGSAKDVINNSDVDEAHYLCAKYAINLPKLIEEPQYAEQ